VIFEPVHVNVTGMVCETESVQTRTPCGMSTRGMVCETNNVQQLGVIVNPCMSDDSDADAAAYGGDEL